MISDTIAAACMGLIGEQQDNGAWEQHAPNMPQKVSWKSLPVRLYLVSDCPMLLGRSNVPRNQAGHNGCIEPGVIAKQ